MPSPGGGVGFTRTSPCLPPVQASKYFSNCGMATAIAKVTSARYGPSKRSAGKPNSTPSAKQTKAAGTSVAQ